MKPRWPRLLGLALLVESCLWLLGACRPWFDIGERIDASKPLLLQQSNSTLQAVRSGVEPVDYRYYFSEQLDSAAFQKLSKVLARNTPARNAHRTEEGSLVDNQNRVLLSYIDQAAVFAYSPKHDLLVWGNHNEWRLNIRQGSSVHTISTWAIKDVQIRPEGTIWLAEAQPWSGIAVLDKEGKFQGWRMRSSVFDIARFAEVSPADLPLLERLLKQIESSYPADGW